MAGWRPMGKKQDKQVEAEPSTMATGMGRWSSPDPSPTLRGYQWRSQARTLQSSSTQFNPAGCFYSLHSWILIDCHACQKSAFCYEVGQALQKHWQNSTHTYNHCVNLQCIINLELYLAMLLEYISGCIFTAKVFRHTSLPAKLKDHRFQLF